MPIDEHRDEIVRTIREREPESVRACLLYVLWGGGGLNPPQCVQPSAQASQQIKTELSLKLFGP